jgi:iron complex transport system permease protein
MTAIAPTRPPSRRRSRSRSRPMLWLAVAVGLLVLAMLAGTAVGAIALSPVGVLATLADRLPGVDVDPRLSALDQNVLLELRLPRVLLAALVGGTLAVAGAGYQGAFRNPMADPYLLGAAAGAGLGATLVISYLRGPVAVTAQTASGGTGGNAAAIPLAAFVGALTGVGLAYAVGRATGELGGTATLLLAGIAVTCFLTAIQTFVMQRNSDSLREVYSWILGQLGSAGWRQLLMVLPYAATSWLVLLLHGRLLDVLAVGDDEATALGVRAGRVRLVVLAAASLGTAAAVAVSGLIAFVGIIVPHAVRRLTGSSYRTVLPLSLLGGASFLVLADLVARTVLSPEELPIGVVTAFFGAPFFAVLLRVARRGGSV